jgi:hypothetical protein
MPQFGGKNTKKTKKTSSSSKRHFTVVKGNKEHGLYISSTPSSAAKKAVTKLCTANKSKKVEFHIREITQGSKKKTYGPYEGYIEKLKEPIELKGRVIKYKPVAKLSGKTGAKKGGMRGGANILDRTKPLKFKIFETEKTPANSNFSRIPPGLLIQKYIDRELIDTSKTKIFYDGKIIEFNFKQDISDKDIFDALYNSDDKTYIVNTLKNTFFIEPGEYGISITIPYILENGEHKEHTMLFLDISYTFNGSQTRNVSNRYLKYTPPPSVASASASAADVLFSESEKLSLAMLKHGLKALGFDRNEYKNGAKKGLISRGFTGMKLNEAYKFLINSYNK